jgi:chorismate mutase
MRISITKNKIAQRPKAYLATKVTGLPISKVKAVLHRMEVRAIKDGYDTVNPLIISDQKLSWEENMKRCIRAMLTCDVVYASQWRNSDGAKMEIEIANRLKIKIIEI